MSDRYKNLDGMKAYSAIGIILMHGFFTDKIIASFSNLTFLFMVLSSFSMCCGYYEKFKGRLINLEEFYKRRYRRIFPFFSILCTIELIVNHILSSLYEWFADLTLSFGLLPNARISVVGVGWFLGVIFAFYMMFPFYIFLIWNKRRAWIAMIISVIMNILCRIYFFDSNHILENYVARNNIIYCSMFLFAGGIIFLYREFIKSIFHRYPWMFIFPILVLLTFYYNLRSDDFVLLLLFSLFVMLLISWGGVLQR